MLAGKRGSTRLGPTRRHRRYTLVVGGLCRGSELEGGEEGVSWVGFLVSVEMRAVT